MPDDGLGAVTTAHFDRWWDPDAGLLWNPPGAYVDLTARRPSTWSRRAPGTPSVSGRQVSWLRLHGPGAIDARAGAGRLTVRCAPGTQAPQGRPGPTLVVHPGPGACAFGADRWHLPGIDLRMSCDGQLGRVVPRTADQVEVPLTPPAGDGTVNLVLDVDRVGRHDLRR